ncbi:rRNA maturation RNase YbeY [Alloscardovia theropitheci]|uniref:Endoribonuclease YbeY n=1 Tax=Alloscardovia theropitheci TaxID=2496842 RepID=A0A4R0QUJ3_9BIFI|nr:rRNA maturation RNase YbeY [Alloscardovia theropitheci]TCD55085.1 rRNA maturation RNase YbeY [Alloscardovia theropitheci]
MSVDVLNESDWHVDPELFSHLGLWVMDQMGISTHSDLTIIFNEPDAMEELHLRWMNLEGPTDVMSFPMDELRPSDGREPVEGMLGDIVLCPAVAATQAQSAGHSTIEELLLLTIHGCLHLLGFDHGEKDQEREMFALQRQLLLTFLAAQPGELDEVIPLELVQRVGKTEHN